MTELRRSSGVLLHPTSLPGPEGIGTIGTPAEKFVDRLADARQSWWQILPLHPPGYGGSPYSSDSAFAGNPYLIDFRRLREKGMLSEKDWTEYLDRIPDAPADRYEIEAVNAERARILTSAFEDWRDKDRPGRADYESFCGANETWLEDYALYEAINRERDGEDWREWPAPLTQRRPDALREAADRLADALEQVRFEQWLFGRQWSALRSYASERGIQIIGDAPIFVAMDSADVWANRPYFQVDASGEPDVVAGVPPDYFSETGQKWGNPVYDWEAVEEDDYQWWLDRLGRVVETVDIVRIDHFRGFSAYWAVPPEAPTAETGEWVDGPGDAFFEAVEARFGDLPFIAEDLGTIDEDVHDLRDRHDLPGMKVMQFAFDGSDDHPFLPHTYPERCVAYTGTHDNDTTRGWFRSADDATRHQVRSYLDVDNSGVVWGMIEAILDSDAALSVVPAQDVLELDSEARMNTPGTVCGNWSWRMTRDQLQAPAWERLGEATAKAGRSDPELNESRT